MHAILHIGTEKTGSTSIQRLLRSNRRLLADRGYTTSQVLGAPSQVALAVAGMPDSPPRRLHRRLGLASAADIESYRRRARQALQQELSGQRGEALLLSCEQLSILLDTEERVERLLAWLPPPVSRVSVLVYLRRQDTFLVSLYSQALKSGRTEPLVVPDYAAAGPGSKFDYEALVARWASVVGRRDVGVRVFEPTSLQGGNVVDDYLHEIGLRDQEGLERPDRRNPSLDAPGAEFLRLMNRYLPDKSSGRDARRGDLSPLITSVSHAGPRLALDPGEARAFVERFAEGNSLIAREYLGRNDGRLFSDDYPDSGDGFEGLTVEHAAEISAKLWTLKQRQLLRLQERLEKLSRRVGGSDGPVI